MPPCVDEDTYCLWHAGVHHARTLIRHHGVIYAPHVITYTHACTYTCTPKHILVGNVGAIFNTVLWCRARSFLPPTHTLQRDFPTKLIPQRTHRPVYSVIGFAESTVL